MAHSEYLFVPTGPRDSCLVCRVTPEVLVDSLQQGTVELCIPHLLAASRHLSGEPHVERPTGPSGIPPGPMRTGRRG